jgi:hypothetical protein
VSSNLFFVCDISNKIKIRIGFYNVDYDIFIKSLFKNDYNFKNFCKLKNQIRDYNKRTIFGLCRYNYDKYNYQLIIKYQQAIVFDKLTIIIDDELYDYWSLINKYDTESLSKLVQYVRNDNVVESAIKIWLSYEKLIYQCQKV